MRILVVEDEPQLARHLTRALVRHGHTAMAEHHGTKGLQRALSDPPDLIVLDLNLPGQDGWSVLTQLRQAQSPARVIILTARGEVEHRIRGLKAGADDYLAKPFSMDELVARVEALGRRGGTLEASDLLLVDDLQVVRHPMRVLFLGIMLLLSVAGCQSHGTVVAESAVRIVARISKPYEVVYDNAPPVPVAAFGKVTLEILSPPPYARHVLHVGVTSERRSIWQHRRGVVEFTTSPSDLSRALQAPSTLWLFDGVSQYQGGVQDLHFR